jgi:5'-nucleotidase
VAGAIEGRFLGRPSIAISMAAFDPEHYASGGRVAAMLVEQLEREPLPADTILNVNVPDLPFDQLKGFRSTRLGHRHKAEPLLQQRDPRGEIVYWVGPAGPEADAGPGTDFHAVKAGYVSVTPLQVDLTRHAALDGLTHWLERV